VKSVKTYHKIESSVLWVYFIITETDETKP